jgi:hypothetical protein
MDYLRKGLRERSVQRVVTVLVAVLALSLSACATMGKPDTEVVADRAQQRWDALLAGNVETAYGYLSPGFRSSVSLVDYTVRLSQRRVQWISAEHLSSNCEADRCSVKFNIGIRVVNAVPGSGQFDSSSVVEETWIRSGGDWWYLPKD